MTGREGADVGWHGIGEEALDRAGDGDANVQGVTSTDGASSHRTGGMTLAQPNAACFHRSVLPSVVVAVGVVLACPAMAQDDVNTGPALAMGGASAAHADNNAALTTNPAAIGLKRRYNVDIVGGFWDGRDYRVGVNAVDAMYTTEGLAMGVAYQYWRTRVPLTTDELPGWVESGEELSSRRAFNNVTIGAALPVAEGRFSVGVNGTLLFINHAVLGSTVTGDMDVGLAGRPTKDWSLGVAVRNVLPKFFPTDDSIGLTAGTRYAWSDQTSVAVDVDVPFVAPEDGIPLSIGGGAEIGQDLRQLGIGYRYIGPTNQHWASLGAGIWSDTAPDSPAGNLAGLHYAAQVPLHGLGSTTDQLLGIRHTLTVSIQPKKQQ